MNEVRVSAVHVDPSAELHTGIHETVRGPLYLAAADERGSREVSGGRGEKERKEICRGVEIVRVDSGEKRLIARTEKKRAADAAWKLANKEKVRVRDAAYRAANPGLEKARNRAWIELHRGRVNALVAKRHSIKVSATPVWANHFFIEEVYDLAQLRTKATGFKWHVDHIVPLQSRLVCGLHVENNLSVIPAIHNITKGNRHWPDMP